jgi:hypothetical protein
MSTEPATPPAVSPSPVAPGPAAPPEGHEGHCEGQRPSPLGEEEIAWIERVARDKSDAYADARDALRALRAGGITEEGKEKVRGLMRSWRCWPEVPSGDVLQLVAEVRRLKGALIFLAVRFRDHAEAKDGKDSEVAQWLTDLIAREVIDPEETRKSMEDFAAGRGRELGEIMADLQAARREADEMRGDREVVS